VLFTMTRERYGPKKMLGKWFGTLITDGYSGFDEVVRENGIVRAGCWAHYPVSDIMWTSHAGRPRMGLGPVIVTA
jgi:Transposase IS66 family